MTDRAMGRISDLCSGHHCWPPTIAITGSSNSFDNDMAIHRVTDEYIPHACPNGGSHTPVTTVGSPSVFVNDLPVAHLTSPTACSPANIMITGSPTTWVEGF